MDVVFEDGEGVEFVVGCSSCVAEGQGNGEGLFACPKHGGMQKRLFSCKAFLMVVRLVGDGDRKVIEASGATVLEEIPGTNAGRSGATRIVGKPESVGGQNDVMCEWHRKHTRWIC